MKSKLALSFLTLTSLAISTQTVVAQQTSITQTYTPSNRIPIADSTLNTQVSGAGNNFDVTGGLTKGQTLFHSFTDFSVPTNGAANFLNPVGNRDIITRVTGSSFSDINGSVNTNGANFFLINPNGIVFGTGAQLNVGKAFVGSTANSIDLVSGGQTITFGTNPAGDAPLLSVAPNVLFDVSRLNLGGGTGQISNFGTLFIPNLDQYIGLIGGDVNINGGQIIALGGRVELGGLSAPGTVGLGTDLNNLQVQFPTNVARGDVSLINGASVTVTGVGGGDVAINARNVDILGVSNITGGVIAGAGTTATVAGNIKINATGDIRLADSSQIGNRVEQGAVGKGGGVEINARNLSVTSGASLIASTFGQGDAGSVKINATGDVFFDGKKDGFISAAFSTVEVGGMGKGGGIEINSRNLTLTNGAELAASTRGKGDAGSIKISATGDVSVTNGAQLAASTLGQGDAGSVKINATGDVSFDGKKDGSASGAFSTVEVGGVGKGGGIEINSRNLTITDGAGLAANTSGQGDAGSVKINATGDVSFDGKKDGSVSGAFSTVEQGGVGKGGGIEINSRNLTITDGAGLTASTRGQGDAGSVKINATSDVSFDGKKDSSASGAFSTVEVGAVGKGGNVEIKVRNLNVTNGAQLQSSTKEEGDAGSVKINATGDVSFDGTENGSYSGALSTVEKGGVGKGGNVEINSRDLSVTNGARLSASTEGQGSAGSVKISATGDVSFDGTKDGFNSTALSTVGQGSVGKGGGIEINSRNLSVTNAATLSASTGGQGDAGGIKITATGDIVFGGNKDGFTSGALSIVEQSGVGNGGGIEINSRNLTLTDGAQLAAGTRGQGDAGSIKIAATGNVSFDGRKDNLPSGIFSIVDQGAIGKGGGIEINSRNLSVTNDAGLFASTRGEGAAGSIKITATENVAFGSTKDALGGKASSTVDPSGVGKGGGIEISSPNLTVTNGSIIQSSTFGQGDAGNIILNTNTAVLNEGGIISAALSFRGGDIKIVTKNYLLLRNDSKIFTDSFSTRPDGNGGNITIDSPLIIASPGNNDITANAAQGNGGDLNITSKGLFGIQFRAKGQESSTTNDITANSTSGRDGNVNIETPGTDPGKDSTELPNVTTDASNQISQTCSANTRENKLTVTGRGGLPPNANDPLTSDVVWQDARAASPQPVASSTTTNPVKLVAPAVGWVFDGKGKVTLVAAGSQGQPTGTNVVCPNATK